MAEKLVLIAAVMVGDAEAWLEANGLGVICDRFFAGAELGVSEAAIEVEIGNSRRQRESSLEVLERPRWLAGQKPDGTTIGQHPRVCRLFGHGVVAVRHGLHHLTFGHMRSAPVRRALGVRRVMWLWQLSALLAVGGRAMSERRNTQRPGQRQLTHTFHFALLRTLCSIER